MRLFMLVKLFVSITATTEDNATTVAPKCNSAFTCSDGGACTQWTDGCNQCSCSEHGAVCTGMFCDCYRTNSCVPQCQDNDNCIPTRTTDPVTSASSTSTSAYKCKSPFTCLDGGTCTQWSDGCNGCSCTKFGGSCTEMYCSCYDTNSCVPQCIDNDNCVPSTQSFKTIKSTGSVPATFISAAFNMCAAWTVAWVSV